MTNFKKSLGMAALATLIAPGAFAATILVDDFTTTGAVVSALQGNPATGAFAGAGILGGERYMWASTDSVASIGTGFEVVAGSGEVSFTNGTGITGQAVLVYDGVGIGATTQNFTFDSVPQPAPGDPLDANFPNSTTAAIAVNTTGLAGVDFLSGGTIGQRNFAFAVNSFDAESSVDFRAYAWDMAGNVATYFENLFNPFPVDFVTFDTNLGLDEFTFGPAFDWSKIGALAFSVESLTPEFDGSLGSISVVPLPASALLLLGGLGALAGMSTTTRRRRRQKSLS